MTIYTQVLNPLTGEINENIIKSQNGDEILWIPNDDGNAHWQEYQAWLAQGNEPNPPAKSKK